MNQQQESIEINIQEQTELAIYNQIKQETRKERVRYSLFLAGSATGAILSSILLTYLSSIVFISSGMAIGVVVQSIYDLYI
jgi:hypothetical protein